MTKEEFNRLLDAVPKEKWIDVERYLRVMAMPEFDPTEEELEAFRQADIERANGELKRYTIEELRKEFLDN